MALKDRIDADRLKVFINQDQFGTEHTWNGQTFPCVTDEETIYKRKMSQNVDVSWDTNTMDILIYVRVEDFPGRPVPNERGYFDGKQVKILQVQTDMGMYTISLTRRSPKALAGDAE